MATSSAMELVTLTNFASAFPPWRPDQESHLYAVVDMGSNGIRFSVTDLAPPRTRLLTTLYRERAAISLFDSLVSAGVGAGSPGSDAGAAVHFPEETISLVAARIAHFARVALLHFEVPWTQTFVLATEAFRRAANGDRLAEAIERETRAVVVAAVAAAITTPAHPSSMPDYGKSQSHEQIEQLRGLKVHVLAGEVEALLGPVGARSGFTSMKGLVLDLGGGSVQMTYLDTTRHTAATAPPIRQADLAVSTRPAGSGDDGSPGSHEVESASRTDDEIFGTYEMEAAQAGKSMPFGAAALLQVLMPTAEEDDDVEGVREEKHPIHGEGVAIALADTIANTTPGVASVSGDGRKGDASVGLQRAANEKQRLAAAMHDAFASIRSRYPFAIDDASGVDLFLCGGGFRGYGSMLLHLDPLAPYYPLPSVAGYTAPGSRFRDTASARAANEDLVNHPRIPGMSKRRRRQFPAVLAVVDALCAAVKNVRSVTFCAGSNREGLLMMMLPREVRESDPVEGLAATLYPPPTTALASQGRQPSSPAGPSCAGPVFDAILSTMCSAVPLDSSAFTSNPSTTSNTAPPVPTVLTLNLAPLFIPTLWSSGPAGDTEGGNAARTLHDAVSPPASHSGQPGFTHLVRAVLAITLCERWMEKGRPPDGQAFGWARELYAALRALLAREQAKAPFWAAYIGKVAAVLCTVLPAWPRKPEMVKESIRWVFRADQCFNSIQVRRPQLTDNHRFEARCEHGKKTEKIFLAVRLSRETAAGTDMQSDVRAIFKDLSKVKDDDGIKLSEVVVDLMD